ncbi:glutamate dehydrogenase [Hyphomonas jannaschiana VP2]|jgi:glutamate dehydrogenase (NADP+)|uniref:Glutamate dehydrogenase n=1 Tax=Hyphomonas jannaschiana VP2 TaxID=1280952 RepID=A0A059FIB9_9PROT|nr:glutamate dehydrogenase [Hyphomonas jannaschiana VP2]
MFQDAGIHFAPGSEANTGGVATSALEMRQNASRDTWRFEKANQRLKAMKIDTSDPRHDLESE